MVNYAINDKHFDEIVLQYYDPNLDHQASEPEVMIGIAGAAVTNMSLVEFQADGKWDDADASSGGAQGKLGFAFTSTALVEDDTFYVVLKGLIRDATWAFTVGGAVYASTTAGEVTQTIPVVAGDTVRMIGYALDADAFWFDPSKTSVGEASGCALLEGHTAYVGFDSCKEPFTNYFLCDGTADDVQIQLAITYTTAQGGGFVHLEEGNYDITASITVPELVSISGEGDVTRLEKTFNGTQVIELTTATVEGQVLRDFMIDGNKATQTGNGIYVNAVSRNLLIENLRVYSCENYGILVNDSWGITIRDCLISYNNFGIVKTGTGNAMVIDNNVIRYNERHAIDFQGGSRHRVINNIIEFCTVDWTYGIRITQGDYIKILNNSFENFAANGACINILGSITRVSETTIAYNYMTEDNICILVDTATDTKIFDNDILGVGTGIDITANSINTWVFKNTNNATTRITDAGTNTILPRETFQFTEVTGGSAVIQVASPTGCYVSDAGGTAIAWGQLPTEVQQVIRLKVWAVAKAGPFAAGGQMHCEYTLNAGASNAAYNTAGKSWNLANHDSEEADYVADDIVHWVIEDGDVGNELANLVAGDSFEILAIFESADDPDGETNAKFRVVEVEYI